ncbi:MAG: tetratricopeptide repeat protein, partial [Bacteroidales bacterium]
ETHSAIEVILKSIKQQPDNASLCYRLAAYLAYAGRDKEANEAYKHALTLDPGKNEEVFLFAPELRYHPAFS